MDRFKPVNKVIIVTGASSGMGKSTAALLASAGAKIFMTARRKERLEALKAEIIDSGGAADYYDCDITKEENCKAIVESCVKTFGRVDGLVNCAGLVTNSTTLEEEFDTETWESILQMDLYSPMFMVKYVYPEMEKAGGGSIVNISSVAAFQHRPPICSGLAYSTAKGAVKTMSRVLADELAPKKIRVNSVYPGIVKSEMTELAFQKGNEKVLEQLVSKIPLKDYGVPDDIAYCVCYLLSDASRYITGRDFIVDGGYVD